MAMAKEIMGVSLIDRSSFLNHCFQRKQNQFLGNPFLVPLERRRAVPLRKVVRGPVAAISEDLVKKALPLPVPADKAEKFKVRAVVTVRNKSKEDFKDSIVKKLDAFTDKIGRNVVLQLVSTEIDPSKPISLFILPSNFLFSLSSLILVLIWDFSLFSSFGSSNLTSVFDNPLRFSLN